MESTGLAAPRFNFNPTRQLMHFFEHRREMGYDEVVSAFIFILSTLPGYQPGNETPRRLINCLGSKRPLDVNRVLAAVIRSIPIPALLQQRPLTFSDVNAFSIAQVEPVDGTSGARHGQEEELSVPQNASGDIVPPAATSPQGQLAYDQQVNHPIPGPAPPTATCSPQGQMVYQQQVEDPVLSLVVVSYENKPLQPPLPPPAAIHGQPLEIPYTGAICTKRNLNFRWKKSAAHCFVCLANKPTPEQVTAIIERARRGLGSCSNCYKPEDRGADKHCLACHTRQIGKTQRHQAKKRAQRSQAALAALRYAQGQQPGSGVAAAPSVNIPGATGAAGHLSGVGAGTQGDPGYGAAVAQNYPNVGGPRGRNYTGHRGAGSQNYSAGAQNYPNFGGYGAQNYPAYRGAGARNSGIIVNNGGIINLGGTVNAAPGPYYVATQGVDVYPGGHGVVNNGVVNGGNLYGDMDMAFNGEFVVNGGNVTNGGKGLSGGNQ